MIASRHFFGLHEALVFQIQVSGYKIEMVIPVNLDGPALG